LLVFWLIFWLLSLPLYYPRDYTIILNLYLKFTKTRASSLVGDNQFEMGLIEQNEENYSSNLFPGVKNQSFRVKKLVSEKIGYFC